jgi:GT2 family glycosyltransferase
MKVAVAISTFRSGGPVIAMVDRIIEEQWPVFAVIVVDSLANGELGRTLDSKKSSLVLTYENHDRNLGSAGNLQRRLELAAAMGADFVLALNHDAAVTRDIVEKLCRHTTLPNLGALYPLRFRTGKGFYDMSGESAFSFRARGPQTRPAADLLEVYWSSSNGALYALAPLREKNLKPAGELWMGWEDYDYGHRLHQNGYRQYIVTAAETVDNYEYKQQQLLGSKITLADKPSWYLYYSVRNLLVINLYRLPGLRKGLKTLIWAGSMLLHVWSSGPAKRLNAFSMYCGGLRDGLLNRRGKWIHP